MKRPTSRKSWGSAGRGGARPFVCGYCDNQVAADLGWDTSDGAYQLRICPQCSAPTFLYDRSEQVPSTSYGKPISELPADIGLLYEEARSAVSHSAPTAAILCSRKVLMHVAVDKGAKAGESFQSYVSFLADNHFIPAGAKEWVDKIRAAGNEANHEIVIKTDAEAQSMIDFVEMLLKVVYEYP